MFVDIQGRRMEVTPALKSYSLDKVSVLNKYMDGNVRVHMTLSVGQKFQQRAEVSVSGKGAHFKGMEENEDMYASIDKVMDKIARQARKYKEKSKDHHASEKSHGEEAVDIGSAAMVEVIQESGDSAIQMSDDEAVQELQKTNRQFVVYRTNDDSGIKVAYYRLDGNIGISKY